MRSFQAKKIRCRVFHTGEMPKILSQATSYIMARCLDNFLLLCFFACKIKQSFLHLSIAVQVTRLSNWMSSINANSDILSCPGRMSYASLCEQENKWCVEGMVRRFWVELVENKVGMAEERMRHLWDWKQVMQRLLCHGEKFVSIPSAQGSNGNFVFLLIFRKQNN